MLHLDETIELANTQNLSHIEWLLKLSDYEVDIKRQNVINHMVKIGYLPLQPGDANLLFQIIDRRCEKKSTIITSSINFDEWSTILHDERVANAIID